MITVDNDFKATPTQKKDFLTCREKVQKIFEKYQAQGLITLQGRRKTCLGSSPIPYTVVCLEAQALTGQRQKNFTIWLEMDTSRTVLFGLADLLLGPKYSQDEERTYQKFKDKDKWIPFFKELVAEMERETTLERFTWRKELEKLKDEK